MTKMSENGFHPATYFFIACGYTNERDGRASSYARLSATDSGDSLLFAGPP